MKKQPLYCTVSNCGTVFSINYYATKTATSISTVGYDRSVFKSLNGSIPLVDYSTTTAEKITQAGTAIVLEAQAEYIYEDAPWRKGIPLSEYLEKARSIGARVTTLSDYRQGT